MGSALISQCLDSDVLMAHIHFEDVKDDVRFTTDTLKLLASLLVMCYLFICQRRVKRPSHVSLLITLLVMTYAISFAWRTYQFTQT